MPTAPHVVDLDGAHAVVIPEWESAHSNLGYYCGVRKFDDSLPKGADLYILCHDGKRAAAVLDQFLTRPYMTSQEIAIGRRPTYGEIARRLSNAGHAVACDTLGPDCDDERLKVLHPPPEGPFIDFTWLPDLKNYRMRCLSTDRHGATTSQRIVLKDGADWREQVRKGYARFSRKAAPRPAALSCLPHVAAALSRIDGIGAEELSRWRARMEAAGVDAHHDVPPLLVAAGAIKMPGDLLWIELRGVRGSYLISSECRYHGDASIIDRTLSITNDLPVTVVTGLVGAPASTIWGDPDLSDMTIARIAKSKVTAFVLDGEVRTLPSPDTTPPDEAAAIEAMSKFEMPSDMRIEGVVLNLMAQLPVSVRLHVYRTLLARVEARFDISPWLADDDRPMVVARDHLIIHHYSSGYYSTTDGISL